MSNTPLSIADMSRETGIAPDTLRVWERRYGFPSPTRNHKGDRSYSQEELERLRLIRQLIDSGQRPGKLALLDIAELRDSAMQMQTTSPRSAEVEKLLEALVENDPAELSKQMDVLLKQYGLEKFLYDVAAPMNHAVGEAWFAGKIGVLDEHRYSEQMRATLTQAVQMLPGSQAAPRVLLTTLPGEQHSIGLLMVACLLRMEGAEVLMLGAQTPLDEIVRGAIRNRCLIVGLSCSAHASRRSIVSQLVRLRKLLPASVKLWAGGSGVSGITALPGGIQLFHDLHQVAPSFLTIASE